MLEREAHSLAARAGSAAQSAPFQAREVALCPRCLLSALAGVALSFLIYTLC